jgi:type 2A phosphatase activator TIP41
MTSVPPSSSITSSTTTTSASASAPFQLLPQNGGIIVGGWIIRRKEGPIASSHAIDTFTNATDIRPPEMVYFDNEIQLIHQASQTIITFSTSDALRLCSLESHAVAENESKAASNYSPANVQVTAAKIWADNRSSVDARQLVLNYDWTYSTIYRGTYSTSPSSSTTNTNGQENELNHVETILQQKIPLSGVVWQPTSLRTNMSLLTSTEPILWYASIPLYEDELHDNGYSSLSVKVRVMPKCFLVLLSFSLRVDGVLLRLWETRLFHVFGTQDLLREYTQREEAWSALAGRRLPTEPKFYADPLNISKSTPVRYQIHQGMKLIEGHNLPPSISITSTAK